MSDAATPNTLHICSVLIQARPEHCADLAQRIAALPDIEVRRAEGSRIVVVMEAADSDTVGDRLAQLGTMPHVLGVNLVFECAERLDRLGEPA